MALRCQCFCPLAFVLIWIRETRIVTCIAVTPLFHVVAVHLCVSVAFVACRFGTKGVYVAMKDFWLQELSGRVSVQVGCGRARAGWIVVCACVCHARKFWSAHALLAPLRRYYRLCRSRRPAS